MANPEHVEIVKKGAKALAKWREAHPDEGLDLIRAELGNEDLTGANLSHANMARAHLYGAELSGADLSDAILVEANLFFADLSGADLSRAVLGQTCLYGNEMAGAKLDGAEFAATSLADLDLSEVSGLEHAVHLYPSSIGIDTIFRSKGNIHPSFLRGCGVPEELIVQLPAIIRSMQPIQFYSCFISHSHRDDKFARRLYGRMRDDKLKVWFAPEDMRGGRKTHEQIDQAIRVYDKLLLVLSEHSMESEWVISEIRWARKKERESRKRVLFPIRLVGMEAIRAWSCFDADGGKDLAIEVREYHIPDFCEWKNHDAFEVEYDKLLRDLKKDERI